MIISASRRTDIPAFYSSWFLNRIRVGFCTVNPFNLQISHVSLRPEDIDIIVFWTRNPLPLLPNLSELDQRGFPTCSYSGCWTTRRRSKGTAQARRGPWRCSKSWPIGRRGEGGMAL
jgi:hypothetical protein